MSRSGRTTSKARQKYPQVEKQSQFWIKDEGFKNETQAIYLQSLRENTITFCVGPAGTGKTYVAVLTALQMLQENLISKIIITKPILEAGDEELGFLPGDEAEKIQPHLEYALEKLRKLVGPTVTEKLVKDKLIEFCPTAYLRGRDFENCFILIDEAQNLTLNGLKLLMTRIGKGSVMAISGDSDQIDLKDPSDSALDHVVDKFYKANHPQIGVVEFDVDDICRHPLITDILRILK